MKKRKIVELIILCFILLGAFIFRIYRIDTNPVGFFCDEAAIGYNAYSLIRTGTDEYGQSWPFFFRSFGAYRNPVPIYSMIPSVIIFGLNEFSVRLTVAITGLLNIFFAFLLFKKLFGKQVGLITAFFLTISPWHIHYSRFGSEYIFFPFWLSLALWLFVTGLEKRKWLPLAALAFGFSLYTYYPAWLIVPIVVGGLFFIYSKNLWRKKQTAFIFCLLFAATLIPLIFGIRKGIALTRWQQVSVFKTDSSQSFNLPEFSKRLWTTYWAHFSPSFLFEKGDIDYPGHFITRFSVREFGELYWFQLPLLFLGFLWLLINLKKPSAQLVILWLAVYPLGSTLIGTDGGGPFAFRSIIGVVPLQVVSALGILLPWKFLKQRRRIMPFKTILTLIIIGASFYSCKSYWQNYQQEYPLYSADFWGWQYGPRKVMSYFLEVKNKYDDLFLMGDFNSPEIFIKFYDPTNICQGRCQVGDLERVDINKRQLYAISTSRLKEIPANFRFLINEKIDYPNGTTAFVIGEIKNQY